MTVRTLSVPGISCDHCKASIEGAVRGLPGVESVSVDIPAHNVDLSFDDSLVGIDQIIEVIEGAGYEVPS